MCIMWERRASLKQTGKGILLRSCRYVRNWELYFQALLTSPLDGDTRLASRSDRFTSEEIIHTLY
jgi:hypothetical protein